LSRCISTIALPDRWFVLSGSVPGGLPADVYAELINTIHAAGGKVLVDTSGLPLAAALGAKPEIAKPNVAELSELTGRSLSNMAEVIEAAKALLIEKGVRLAVVSMGEEGSIFANSEEALLAVPPKVTVRSTVGAGDAMVAGIVLGEARGMSLEATAILASSLGTYEVTRIGSGLESPDAFRPFGPRIHNITRGLGRLSDQST